MFLGLLPTRWVGVTINFCARRLPNVSDFPRRGWAGSFCSGSKNGAATKVNQTTSQLSPSSQASSLSLRDAKGTGRQCQRQGSATSTGHPAQTPVDIRLSILTEPRSHGLAAQEREQGGKGRGWALCFQYPSAPAAVLNGKSHL